MSIYLKGSENLQKIFKEFPEQGFRKPIVAGFRKAAEPVKRAMASSLPSNLRQIKKIIKARAGTKTKNPSMAVGFFFNEGLFKNKRGKHFDAYTILFWHNYGTLDWRANRFHKFKTPVRRKTKADRMRGIRPGLYAERAWESSKGQAQKAFDETTEKEITKFLEANSYK